MPYVRHQIWHMDDFLLIGTRKSDLRSAMRSLQRYMENKLGVSVKPWKVAKTSTTEPLDLGGWVVKELVATRHMPDETRRVDGTTKHARVLLRGGIFLRGRKAFRSFARTPTLRRARRVTAYWGWFRHADLDRYILDKGINKLVIKARKMISRAGKELMWSQTVARPS